MAAYSATLEVSLLQEYPDLAWLVDIPNTNVWCVSTRNYPKSNHSWTKGADKISTQNCRIGQDRSIETYTLHAHSLFHMIFVCPDSDPPDKGDESPDAMRQKIAKDFADWDPM